jgi:hypothetical protein
MSADKPLPSPWKEFLAEIDGMLNEPLVLHCVGGFVFTLFYGFARTTGDLDYYTAVPSNFNLFEVAGEGSQLHKKYGLCLHKAGVTNLPEDYETRLSELAEGQFKKLRLLVPDPYDCILSKIERNGDVDVNDAEYLFRSRGLSAQVLRERYEQEFRPNIIGDVARTDTTLKLWIEIFTSET